MFHLIAGFFPPALIRRILPRIDAMKTVLHTLPGRRLVSMKKIRLYSLTTSRPPPRRLHIHLFFFLFFTITVSFYLIFFQLKLYVAPPSATASPAAITICIPLTTSLVSHSNPSFPCVVAPSQLSSVVATKAAKVATSASRPSTCPSARAN